METERLTNEMIEKVVDKLSPPGKELLDQIERSVFSPGEDPERAAERVQPMLDAVEDLPGEDQRLISRALQLRSRAFEMSALSNQSEAEELKRVASLHTRAQELGLVGKDATVGEAFEKLREAGKLSEDEEAFAAYMTEREVEVPDLMPVPEKIDHQKRGFMSMGPITPLELWLDKLLLQSLRHAAAGVALHTGSLDTAVRVLSDVGFRVPPGYFDPAEDLYREGEESLSEEEVQLSRFIELEKHAIRDALYTPAFRASAEGARAKIREDPS